MSPKVASSVSRWALLALLLALLAIVQYRYDPPLARKNGRDGCLYYNIARHVAEGDGLRTSVSLYHQGLNPLPHPITIYPLWPLTLGLVGRVFGLDRAVHLLQWFYLVDLLLLYLLVNRMMRRTWGESAERIVALGPVPIDAGLVAAALLGTNWVFLWATSRPYTEGLTFACVFAALLALDEAVVRRSLLLTALAGALAGASYLSHYQEIVVPVAVCGALALGGRRDRWFLRAAASAAGGALVACLPWAIFLARSLQWFKLSMLIDFAAYHSIPEIKPFRLMAKTGSVGEYLLDRLRGFGVAFDPRDQNSYYVSFGALAYAIPLGVALAAVRVRAGLRMLREAPPAQWVTAIAILLVGLGLMAAVHLTHWSIGEPWTFGFRHGLGALLVVFVVLGYVLRREQLVLRVCAIVLVVWSLYAGAKHVISDARAAQGGEPSPAEQALAAWLDGQSPPPVIATSDAQWLGYISRARVHWVHCHDTPTQLERMFQYLDVQYVVTYPEDLRCKFAGGIEQNLEAVQTFGPVRVFQRKRGSEPQPDRARP